jgi:hypothetical protein
MKFAVTFGVLLIALSAASAEPAEETSLAIVSAIKEEGLRNSHVMAYAQVLNDELGARLTGSPQFDRAAQWAVNELAKAGVAAHTEDGGPFGLAWTHLRTELALLGDSPATYAAQATPWSPGLAAAVEAPVVLVPELKDTQDFAAWRGKLRGRIVLYGLPPANDPDVIPGMVEITPQALKRAEQRRIMEKSNRESNIAWARQAMFNFDVARFFASEGALAVVRTNGSGKTFTNDDGTTMGFNVYRPDRRQALPSVVMEADGYGRLARMATGPKPPSLRLDIQVWSGRADARVVNVIGELAASDHRMRDQVVMVGAHLDSWTAGTGATDDGAAVAIQLEALRILKAIGYRPRRPIRIAFWGGEEQGDLGSRAYVANHLAIVTGRGDPADVPDDLRVAKGYRALTGYRNVSAYFNMDAGGGRILGLSTGGNDGAARVFRQWLESVTDLGVSALLPGNPQGVDLWSFAEVGIPAFSFTQDLRDYDSRTHHTNLDVYERLSEHDMKQAATALAVLLYHAGNDDRPLPRIWPKPVTSDPVAGQER